MPVLSQRLHFFVCGCLSPVPLVSSVQSLTASNTGSVPESGCPASCTESMLTSNPPLIGSLRPVTHTRPPSMEPASATSAGFSCDRLIPLESGVSFGSRKGLATSRKTSATTVLQRVSESLTSWPFPISVCQIRTHRQLCRERCEQPL